jgi:hypothetical protein
MEILPTPFAVVGVSASNAFSIMNREQRGAPTRSAVNYDSLKLLVNCESSNHYHSFAQAETPTTAKMVELSSDQFSSGPTTVVCVS